MEEIKKIEVSGQQYGVADMLMRSVMGGNAQVIEWSDSLNLNTLTQAGTYRIKGERLSNTDNLPIANAGSGNTIDAILQVLDSSLNDDEPCITQILTLSNRYGKDGDIYIRSAFGWGVGDWEPWAKLQTNIEVGQVNSLDSFIDNGIYSGVWTDGTPTSVGSFYDTFVMVVINNYAVSGPLGQTRSISQFKYSLGLDGTVTFKSRVGQGGNSISWDEWKEMSGGGDSLVRLQNYNGDDVFVLGSLPNSIDSYIGVNVAIDHDVMIGSGTIIKDDKVSISNLITMGSVTYRPDAESIFIGAGARISIDNRDYQPNSDLVQIQRGSLLNAYIGTDVSWLSKSATKGTTLVIGTGIGIGLDKETRGKALNNTGVVAIGQNINICDNVTIGTGVTIMFEEPNTLRFSSNGKTATLELT